MAVSLFEPLFEVVRWTYVFSRSTDLVNMSLILGGALTSLLTITAGIAGFMVAFPARLLRFKKVPVLDRIAAGYIDFIRNTPLIVQLFFIAFGLPMLFGYVWPFWCHALLALTINFLAISQKSSEVVLRRLKRDSLKRQRR